MNIHNQTFVKANDLAALKMDGFLIELCGEIALIRRRMPAYSDQDKSYVITHYSSKTNSFYWSAYDMTLADAVNMFYRETLEDKEFKLLQDKTNEHFNNG